MASLTEHNLHTIEDLLKEGKTAYFIAKRLGRHVSVISRLFLQYPKETFVATEVILARCKRKSTCSSSYHRIEPGGELDSYICHEIQERHSPEQIAGSWVNQQKESGKEEHLSKDTIYAFIYEYHPEYIKTYLRRKGKKYRDRKKEQADKKYSMGEQRSIEERDKLHPLIHDRDTYNRRILKGHYEGDTIVGKDRQSALLTVVERSTGYVFIRRLEFGNKDSWSVMETFRTDSELNSIPTHIKITLTFDNGREFAHHKLIEFHTGFTVYFAHPYHSWERGTNENTNGLIREYFPKGTDFNQISDERIAEVQKAINMRPRKRLGYRTPFQLFHETSCVSV